MITGRQRLDNRLDAIRASILKMGAITGEMVRMAVQATIASDALLAAQVVAMDDEVDILERETVRAAITSVGLEAPVAGDLRFLVEALGMVGEVENVADDAVKLARRAAKLAGHFPPEMRLALQNLGTEVDRLFGSALHLFVDYSDALADEIVRADKAIDSQYTGARNRIFDLIRSDPDSTEHLVRAIEAFHALEHVADHSVEIARRMQILKSSF